MAVTVGAKAAAEFRQMTDTGAVQVRIIAKKTAVVPAIGSADKAGGQKYQGRETEPVHQRR